MIQQTFNLNLIPESAPVIVRVNQYDTGTGRLVFKLYKGSSEYTPGAGATAIIQGTKPDMHGFAYDATISGSTVTANLTQQMSAVYGNTRAQIVVTESNGKTGSFAFTLKVQQSALEDDTDISDTELPALIDLAEANAERAEAAVEHYPYINSQNDHWMVWDVENEEWVDTGVNAGGEGADIANSIAPTESDATSASQPYAVNEQFYLSDGNLYTATSPISQGSAIVVYPTSGYNCKLSDSVTGQIKAIKDTLGTASTKNSTSVVTQSTDLVESGAVYDAIVDTVGWKWKNRCKPYNYTYADATISVIYSNNAITVNGTSNSSVSSPKSQYARDNGIIFTLKKGTYTISLSGDKTNIEPQIIKSDGSGYIQQGEGTFTLDNDTDVFTRIFTTANASYDNQTCYMQIERGSTATAYEPYHASVADSLTDKCDNSVIAPVEDGATASQAYAVGSHFIRNGAFCTVTSPISANESLVGSSKFTSGDVADELEVSLVTCVIENHQNITINSSRNNLFRYGKLRYVDVGFTVNSDISVTGSTALFTLNDASIGVFSFEIQRGSSPYEKVTDYSLYTNGGRYINANNITIPAGNYIMSGFYLGN
ncbi:MAG: hypothetical protein J6S14_22985 [Clostridia bacterium]|nr:hypothetical protein [Clostridia bacterium]